MYHPNSPPSVNSAKASRCCDAVLLQSREIIKHACQRLTAVVHPHVRGLRHQPTAHPTAVSTVRNTAHIGAAIARADQGFGLICNARPRKRVPQRARQRRGPIDRQP